MGYCLVLQGFNVIAKFFGALEVAMLELKLQ
jgi:hypothetical protein